MLFLFVLSFLICFSVKASTTNSVPISIMYLADIGSAYMTYDAFMGRTYYAYHSSDLKTWRLDVGYPYTADQNETVRDGLPKNVYGDTAFFKVLEVTP